MSLQTIGLDAIVVGGQAVNLWADQYQLTDSSCVAGCPRSVLT